MKELVVLIAELLFGIASLVVGWARNSAELYGDTESVKAKLINLISAVRTLMRIPLIAANVVVIIYALVLGMSQRGEQQSTSDRGSLAGTGAVTAPVATKIGTDVVQRTWVEPQAGSTLDAHGWRMSLYENRTLASAITAAVTGMLVGYPFDSLKTRMQTYHYPSLLACARKSIAEEGVRGLYRGLLPPLLTASAAKSLSFSVFEETKHWLRRHDPFAAQQAPLGLANFQRKTVGSVALSAGLSGSISGAVIAILCCPLELIKVQMQLARLLNRDLTSSDTATAASKPVGALVSTPAGTLQGGGAAIATRQLRNAPAAPPWAASNLSVLREIVRRRGPSGMYYGIGLHIGK
ncbi:hypothetical protein IW146_002733 [Coemansia sp. RSA 922]|nr:hypothetical protein IW146_002733 [Coemansia sp. RSA 922]